MTKATRAKTGIASDETSSKKKIKSPAANQKVFFFHETLLNESEDLKLEFFYHPGKGKRALFIADVKSKNFYEVKEISEPHRSWLIDNNVCSNGKVYITVPLDCTFLALYFLKQFCTQKAMALDDIIDDNDPSVHTFLSNYTARDRLEVVADVKTAAGMKFFKYNQKKTLMWLAIKVRNLAGRLKAEGIYCGFSSLSQNYKKSEVEQNVSDKDYLRNACEIVGSYVELVVHDELKEYLGVKEMENKSNNNKRKSTSSDTSLSKKIKLEDSSSEGVEDSPKPIVPVKEKKITAKEKALAKGAKGTKSISSFFKK